MAGNLRVFAWAWLIIIGGIMITPGGIIPIVHSRVAYIVMGVISIALGVAGFMSNRSR